MFRATRSFPTTTAEFKVLLRFLTSYGRLADGVEGTGCWAAASRWLAAHDVWVIEVDRPNGPARRRRGRSDPINAEGAAPRRRVSDGSLPAYKSRPELGKWGGRSRDRTFYGGVL